MAEQDERRCPSCDGLVDADGATTTGGCPVNRPDDSTCRECGACFCDGSC